MHFYKQVIDYCKEVKAPVSPAFIKARLKSHPDYPNLSSLTDTLDELEISYTAFVTDKSNYASLQYPMFVHINTPEEEYFTVVKSKTVFDTNKNNIRENWDGTTIIIQNPQPGKNGIHEKWWKKYKSETTTETFLLLSLAMILALVCIFSQSIITSLLLLLSTIGLIACYSLFKFEIGLDTFVSKALCSTEGSCSKTLSKDQTNLLSKLPLSDIGVIYFTFQILYGLVSMVSDNTIISIYPLVWTTLIATLFVIPSLYVQAFVLKAWCKMCLLVLGVLMLEGVLGWIFMRNSIKSFESPVQHIGLSAIFLSLASFAWLRMKTVLVESYKALENYIDFQKWKRDPFIFFSLLYNQKRLKSVESNYGMRMGNNNPKLLITMACSPYCNPCAATHKVLDTLLRINKDIQIDVKFAFSPQQLDPKINKAMKLILSAYKKEGGIVLHEWFQRAEQDAFEKKYVYDETLEEEISKELLQHADWSSQNNIRHTPTLFLNGYQMPQQYNPDDLIPLINIITEEIAVKESILTT